MNTINLHIHTSASDGLLSGEEVVDLAIKSGLKYISITDHDSVLQVLAAKSASKDTELTVIPGVELTADFNGKQCHILGYGVNLDDITSFSMNIKNNRIERAKKIISLLRNDGYAVDYDEILKTSVNGIISRRDIVKYLVKKEYCGSIEEGMKAFFNKESKYSLKIAANKITDCINIIKKSNGVAILAHPWTLNLDNDSLVNFLHNNNFDGLEVYNHNIDDQMFKGLKEIADNNNFLMSCGTDFHGYGNYNNIMVDKDVDCNRLLKTLEKKGKL